MRLHRSGRPLQSSAMLRFVLYPLGWTNYILFCPSEHSFEIPQHETVACFWASIVLVTWEHNSNKFITALATDQLMFLVCWALLELTNGTWCYKSVQMPLIKWDVMFCILLNLIIRKNRQVMPCHCQILISAHLRLIIDLSAWFQNYLSGHIAPVDELTYSELSQLDLILLITSRGTSF